MVVEIALDNGEGLVRGDKFSRYFFVNRLRGNTLAEAWLTVKSSPTNDADGAAIFQKVITSGNVAGTGQIEDIGTNGTANLRFDLTTANTEAMTAGTKYTYDVQVRLTTSNDILTLVKGPAVATEQVTRDT